VVVLDEIGLAEASSSMPLKVLHPLLEDGNLKIKVKFIAMKARKRENRFQNFIVKFKSVFFNNYENTAFRIRNSKSIDLVHSHY
jgi:hypothetical protein